MKTSIRNLCALTLIAASIVLIIASCQNEEDITPPVIMLSGDNPYYMDLNADYNEPGFSATDNEDGEIPKNQVSVLSNVQKDKTGNYTITYSATDNAGNTGVAERKVIVSNIAEFLAGTYSNANNNCQNPPGTTFNAEVTTSTTENGVFNITNFGGYGQNVVVQFEFDEQTSSITASPNQSLGGTAVLESVNIAGVTNHSNPVEFFVNYNFRDGATGNVCNATFSK